MSEDEDAGEDQNKKNIRHRVSADFDIAFDDKMSPGRQASTVSEDDEEATVEKERSSSSGEFEIDDEYSKSFQKELTP